MKAAIRRDFSFGRSWIGNVVVLSNQWTSCEQQPKKIKCNAFRFTGHLFALKLQHDPFFKALRIVGITDAAAKPEKFQLKFNLYYTLFSGLNSSDNAEEKSYKMQQHTLFFLYASLHVYQRVSLSIHRSIRCSVGLSVRDSFVQRP